MQRSSRIKLAFALAGGFILLRLGYAFVFAGLWGDRVLFEIPQLQLPGPFRSVTLFGPVALDGIARNIELALPFALTILGFGLLSSFVVPGKFLELRHRAGRFSWLFITLGTALGSIEQLIRSAADLRWALRLRGELAIAIVVPLFERSVSRAMNLALQLARGSARSIEPATLSINNLSVAPLRDVSLTLEPGSVVLLSGATGSGKTTLLRAIAGELFESDDREVTGEIRLGRESLVDFASASAVTYLVPQLPQASFIAERVNGNGLSEALRGKRSAELSHGEAYRFAVDLALERNPQVLLLDEPAAALDYQGLVELKQRITALAAAGRIVVIADHRLSELSDVATDELQLEAGQLRVGRFAEKPLQVRRLPAIGAGELAIQIRIDSVARAKILIESVNLDLKQGECLAILGSNGVGKSSLLAELASADQGQVRIYGEDSKLDPTQVAMVPDRPSDFFVTATLREELKRADRITKAPVGLTQLTLESILGSVEDQLEIHPLDLSVGTQLALAIAMQLSHKPQLLLLDEPVQGLDRAARELMAETIRCVQETGCAVLFATHDEKFATISDRVFEIVDSKLKERSGVKG